MSDSAERISYLPTDGLSYDPSEPVYWDPVALEKETLRAFEICHGCRMCFKYCDSFPTLFALLDEKHEGDVRRIDAAETAEVMDHCFQCKLCEVQCPYTPRDKHEFQLDFPRLVHRHAAQRARRARPSLRDRVLADPDGAARAARMSLGLANALNKVPLHRILMEKVLGIHREKLLPPFASSTFERWAERQGLCDPPANGSAPEAVLFPTCYVQNNEPEIGRDAVEVLQRNQVNLVCKKGLACCGMPAWEKGDLEALRAKAKQNLDLLMPEVERGAKVLVINPTCSMTMRREWPELLEGADRERARVLAPAVMDCAEFLWSIREEQRFDAGFASAPAGKVAYHAPCHLRAQGIGFRGRDLLRKIPGVQPVTTMECCGHDGTFAMRTEHFEASKRLGKRAFDGMQDAGCELWVSECPLAALQFEQHAGKKALHPLSVLARAYRADGFARRVEHEQPRGESA